MFYRKKRGRRKILLERGRKRAWRSPPAEIGELPKPANSGSQLSTLSRAAYWLWCANLVSESQRAVSEASHGEVELRMWILEKARMRGGKGEEEIRSGVL